MSHPSIYPVILCGGSGTRLWPLSRESTPKQFIPLVNGKSLLQATLERVASFAPVLCVSNNEHRFFVQEALLQSGVTGKQLLEPVGRNTSAAMACASLLVEPDQLLLFCPADHHIPDTEQFITTVQSAIPAALDGYIVTFGIHPTFPSTGYGYIQQGLERGAARLVQQFVEKPTEEFAQTLLLSGNYLWNAGIFLCKASTLLGALDAHAPDILETSVAAMKVATHDGNFVRPETAAFLACRSESIDFAVMERFDKVAVVPFKGQWSDVGNWNAVANLTVRDKTGNQTVGNTVLIDTTDTYVNASRPVVTIGINNLLVVDTPDALLVAAKSHAEQVKQAVEILKTMQISEAVSHRRVAKPWGWYDRIDSGNGFQVKRIAVNPGASLSLQSHRYRAEHWVVVNGTAEVTKGNEIIEVAENESVYIPVGVKHRLRNPGQSVLEIIEVQTGSYLGEDDIIRYKDNYDREDRISLAIPSLS